MVDFPSRLGHLFKLNGHLAAQPHLGHRVTITMLVINAKLMRMGNTVGLVVLELGKSPLNGQGVHLNVLYSNVVRCLE